MPLRSAQRSPFSAVAAVGSPSTPLGAISRVSHAKLADEPSGLSSSGLIDVRDVIGGVGSGCDQLRRGVQQKRSFHLAGVKTVGALLRAEAFERGAGRAEERKGAQAELRAQIAGHHVDERSVAAVRVVEDELLETAGRDARAQIAHHGHESRAR